MQEEQRNEETQLEVGPAAKFSKGKTRGRKDERTSQSQGPAGKHLAQERGVEMPGVRLSSVKC